MGQIPDLHVNTGLAGLPIRSWAEMGCPMLTLDGVIGLASVDPVAIDTDAHAARSRP
jgi:hypothetical protein